MLTLTASVLSEVFAHAESDYPREACGVLLSQAGAWRVHRMSNVYDRYHAADPLRFPRSSRTAYLFDPKEWLRLSMEAEAEQAQIACVYHSHVDAGAYFSAEDRAMAAPDGEPILPSTAYLVVSVASGKAAGAKLFRWESGDFQEYNVGVGNL